mmetsp:Transcript_16339/g.41433  ORF Transcript_16339/g.41433 Transcript_16339/m.41433 type:complete len:129 (+) Transcript_16339:140-526(+)
MSDRIISHSELAKHTTKEEGLWFAINGSVYDFTDFLHDHPGGDQVMIDEAGTDATDAFEDVGHSDDARNQLEKMLVGTLEKGSGAAVAAAPASKKASGGKKSGGMNVMTIIVPLLIVAAAVYLRYRHR